MTLVSALLALAPAFAGPDALPDLPPAPGTDPVPTSPPADEPSVAPADGPSVAPGPVLPQLEAEDLYLEALAAWNRRRYRDALEGTRAALTVDPLHGPSRLLQGYALLR